MSSSGGGSRFAVGNPSGRPALVAVHDGALDLRRPSEQRRCVRDLTGARTAARMWLDETLSTSGTRRTSKPSCSSSAEVARPAPAEAEAVARRDHLGADRAQHRLGERLRRECERAASSKWRTSVVVDTRPPASSSSRRSSVVEQLDSACRAAARGCGSKVTTVGRRLRRRAASRTRRCPRWTPSNVPIATARRAGSSSSGARATITPAPRSARARRDSLTSTEGVERIRRHGLRDVERADLGSPQRPAVAAERVRDRSHVRPGADAQVETSPTPSLAIRDDVERVHRASVEAASRPRRRAARSRYARSPPIFTADAAGIGSSISPRRAASRRRAPPRDGAACRSSHLLPDRRSRSAP